MSDMRKTVEVLEALEWALEELEFVEFQNRASEEAQKWELEFENWTPLGSNFQQGLHADLEAVARITEITEQIDRDYMTSCEQSLSCLGFGLGL